MPPQDVVFAIAVEVAFADDAPVETSPAGEALAAKTGPVHLPEAEGPRVLGGRGGNTVGARVCGGRVEVAPENVRLGVAAEVARYVYGIQLRRVHVRTTSD